MENNSTYVNRKVNMKKKYNFNNNNVQDESGIVSTDEEIEDCEERDKMIENEETEYEEIKKRKKPRKKIQSNSYFQLIWNLINPNKLSYWDYIPDEDADYLSYTEDESYFEMNTNAAQCKQRQSQMVEKMKYVAWKVFLFSCRMILKLLRIARNMILLAYFIFILVCNLPFAILKNILRFLQCLTGTKCLHLIPIRLPFALYEYILYHIQQTFVCKHKTCKKNCGTKCFNLSNKHRPSKPTHVDSNLNNSVIGNSNSRAGLRCKGMFCANPNRCLMFMLGSFLLYMAIRCYFTPDAGLCKLNHVATVFKAKFIEHFAGFYYFPGLDCMTAGRCCKGYLEGFFRWMACAVTIPFRIILAAWPKEPVQTSSQDGINGVKNYVEKIMEEINEVKEELTSEEEDLIFIQTNFITLEQKVNEKAAIINKIKPKLMRSIASIDELEKDLKVSLANIHPILSIRNDADRILEAVRIEAHDSATLVKGSLARLRTSLEAEHHRLKTQIMTLEKVLRDEQQKSSDRNVRVLMRLQTEIENLKNIQHEIKKRLIPLQDLTKTYKDLADTLQKDLRNKLAEEMVHHEQMSKRTEKFCLAGVDKLQKDLAKARYDLTCFINKTVKRDAEAMGARLLLEVTEALHEQTVDLARKTVDQAIANFIKKHNLNQPKKIIKRCSLFSHVFGFSNDGTKHGKLSPAFNASALCKSESYFGSVSLKRNFDELDEIIDEHIRLLSADRIGKADYAFESSGGSVIIGQTTPTYTGRAAFLSLFGVTFGKVVKSVKKIIQPGALPGECWAFQGPKGHVVIKLARLIKVTAVTIDHVDKRLTPTGDIPSAPKSFDVYGLERFDSEDRIKLGSFEYNKDGESIQTFNIIDNDNHPSVQYVRFNFLSNHGNDEYTCIYRLRVHGNLTVY